MGRGGYIGGHTTLGGGGRESGYPTHDPAESIRGPKRNSGQGSNQNRTYTDERTIVDHLIMRTFDPNIRREFPRNTDPRLKRLIQEKYEDPYEWAKQQPLFRDRFKKIRKSWDNQQERKSETNSQIGDKSKLEKNIYQLQKKRAELCDKVEEIDQEILLLKSILENK